jgi:hypothetical protein
MDMEWNEEAAAKAAIRDEVERVLRRAAYPGVDIDAVHRRPYIAAGLDQQGRFKPCAGGPCQGGTKLCPAPDSCQRMEDDDSLSAARGIIVGIACALAIWAGASALWLSLS